MLGTPEKPSWRVRMQIVVAGHGPISPLRSGRRWQGGETASWQSVTSPIRLAIEPLAPRPRQATPGAASGGAFVCAWRAAQASSCVRRRASTELKLHCWPTPQALATAHGANCGDRRPAGGVQKRRWAPGGFAWACRLKTAATHAQKQGVCRTCSFNRESATGISLQASSPACCVPVLH